MTTQESPCGVLVQVRCSGVWRHNLTGLVIGAINGSTLWHIDVAREKRCRCPKVREMKERNLCDGMPRALG
jgi:hypothetical protein